MEIWLRQGKTGFRFAVLPPEYGLTCESGNTQVSINSLGEINLLGKRKLKSISLSSFFPKQRYDFCQYASFPEPKESVRIIEGMRDRGVMRLIITGTPVNMECTIENFTWGENGATQDINFTLEFKEYRKVRVLSDGQMEKITDIVFPAATQRGAKEVESTTYTVAVGDTLSKVAKNLTGSTANWKALRCQNETAAYKMRPGEQLVMKL